MERISIYDSHSSQNFGGSREDILFSIILDPSSDECVPLLARVFAGKTKEELLCSHEAMQAQVKLHSIVKHTADVVSMKARHRKHQLEVTAEGAKSEKSPLKSTLGLGGLELKVEEEERSEGRKSLKGKVTLLKPATASSARFEMDSAKSGSMKAGGSLKSGSVKSGSVKWRVRCNTGGLSKPSSQPMTSEAVLLGTSRGGGDLMNPREWSVLSYPLPKFPSSSHSLLASIQDAFKESHFHKSIYYAKKTVNLIYSEYLILVGKP